MTFNNIQNTKIKENLLLDQANDISNKFEEFITIIENELNVDDNQSMSSIGSPNIFFATKLLITCTKIYNDFMFIKNGFEMDSEDLRCENQFFNLKEYYLYSVDLLLSQKQKSQVDISLDPCLPLEVEGDLTKFRQIITAILDFSLKSTQKVSAQLRSNFILETGGYDIDFKIRFTPEFALSK